MPKQTSNDQPCENAVTQRNTEILTAVSVEQATFVSDIIPDTNTSTPQDRPTYPPELLDTLDHSEDPNSLPEMSFLSLRPQTGAFVWVTMFAIVSAVLSLLASSSSTFASRLLLPASDLLTWKASYGLLTSMLVHSGLDHYLGNMILLVPMAGFTSAYYGFWVFPVIGITLGCVTHAIALWTYPPYMHLVGSSGLLYAIFGIWITLYAFVESHLAWRRRVLRLSGFIALMLLPHTYSPTTSYRAHGIGFVLGVVGGIFIFLLRRQEFATRNASVRMQVFKQTTNSSPAQACDL